MHSVWHWYVCRFGLSGMLELSGRNVLIVHVRDINRHMSIVREGHLHLDDRDSRVLRVRSRYLPSIYWGY